SARPAFTRSLGAPLRLAPTTRRPFSSAWYASPPPIRPRPITPNSSIPLGAAQRAAVRWGQTPNSVFAPAKKTSGSDPDFWFLSRQRIRPQLQLDRLRPVLLPSL